VNERIKELAEQALKHPDTDNDGLTVFDNDELEKFAESIVKECVGLALNFEEITFGQGYTLSKQIKKHFGVK